MSSFDRQHYNAETAVVNAPNTTKSEKTIMFMNGLYGLIVGLVAIYALSQHFGIVISLALYFIPTIIAVSRSHYNSLVIGMINLLLGWTVVGWLFAFFWALTCNVYKESAAK